jgi:methionyl aminopeptidase
MVTYKTSREIDLIRRSASILSETLAEVAKFLKPGVTTAEVDALAEQFIILRGGIPSFKNYHGFPNATCLSVNEAVVHGIPGSYVLQEGDIISVDIGVLLDGYHADSAYTFAIGPVKPEVLQLLGDTKASLYEGIGQAKAGNRIGDISYAVQKYTEIDRGYGVVRELVGHGLGKKLHEDPQVPNYGRRGNGLKLREGLVIAIEPMINLGTRDVTYKPDGWTVVTRDGKPSAHFEHTVLVRKGQAEVLSSFDEIEAAESQNPALSNGY